MRGCYSAPDVGRLDNIIARNRRPNQNRERVIVSLVFGSIVLLILALAVFTDLGAPPAEPAPAPVIDDHRHVNDVYLGAPRKAKPPAPATKTN